MTRGADAGSRGMHDGAGLFGGAAGDGSRDGVICWLLDWAGFARRRNPGEEALRRLGRRFVEALFAKWRDYPVRLGEGVAVEMRRQVGGIDVLVRVDRRYLLLVEDRTGTGPPGGQLRRCREDVIGGRTPFGAVRRDDVYPVYLTTGNLPLSEVRRLAREEECAVFGRGDFLAILNSYRGNDATLLGCRAYLREIEDRTNGYVAWTAGGPRDDPLGWEGLFRRIQEDFAGRRLAAWGHAADRRHGGFSGVWWRPRGIDAVASLGLERRGGQAELEFRLEVRDPRGAEALQQRWHAFVMAAGRQRVAPPGRTRAGATVAVAVWADEVLAFGGADGRLDVPGTIRRLRAAESVLHAASRAVASRGG